MANAVFAYDNLAADDCADITAASALVTHPASKLIDGLVSQRCWMDAHTGTIYIDLGSGTPAWGLVALLGTNLDGNLEVTLEATDDASWVTVDYGPVDLPVSAAGKQGNRWLRLAADRTERYLRLVIDEASGGSDFPDNAKIGQLLVASPLRLATNFSQGYGVQKMAGTNVVRTAYGVTRAYKFYEPMESWQIPFSLYPREDHEKLAAMWEAVDGPCHGLLFIPDPGDSDRLALWCRAAESLQSQYDYWKFHDMGSLALPLIEEPMSEELDTLPGNHAALALLLDPRGGMLTDEVSGGSLSFARSTQGTYIDPDTGAVTTAAIDEARFEKIRGQKALLVEGGTIQQLLNSQTPANQTTSSLDAGIYVLWCEGTGSAAVAANTATITGAGTATEGAPVVFEVTSAGTVDVTVSGSLTFFQLEGMPIPTSHIYSTGSATVRGLDVCTLALSSAVKKILRLDEALSGLTPDTTHTRGVELDLTDEYALVAINGQDISGLAGSLVVLTDSAGNQAWARTKIKLGTETDGAELISDPTMDAGCGDGWQDWGCDTDWTISGGVASKVAGADERSLWEAIYQDDGRLIEVEIEVSAYSAGNLYVGGGGFTSAAISATGSHTIRFTNPEGNDFIAITGDAACVADVTRCSAKYGEPPSGTGLKCFKSDGTTRGWAGKEPGFDPNDIASAKFYPAASGVHSGTALITWAPGFDPADTAANQNIIATDDAAAPLNITPDGSLSLIDDMENEALLEVFNWEAGGYYRLLAQWNFTDAKIGDLPPGKMRVGYMATTGQITWLGTPVDYCGAFGLDGTLRLARGFGYLTHYGKLALYSTVLSDDELRGEAFA